jgi:hypothetical protein
MVEPDIKTVEDMEITPPEQVDLVLLLLNEKQATEIALDSDEYPAPSPVHKVSPDTVEAIRRHLNALPIAYDVSPERLLVSLARKHNPVEVHLVDDGRTRMHIDIATDADTLQRLQHGDKRNNEATLGQLYGFPETAITAYINGDVIDEDELPNDVIASPAYAFTSFRLSRDHWQQELATGERWAKLIQQYSPRIYTTYMELEAD